MNHLLSLFGTPRSRFPLIVAVAVCLAASFVGSPAQVRPLLGKLTVRAPRYLLPSDDYWIYVNGQIVGAPPHGPFVVPPNMIHESGTKEVPKEEFWDADGEVAKSVGGKLVYVRQDVASRIFQDQTLELAPGSYKVELMTRAVQKDDFPFAITTLQVDVTAGTTQTVEFGIPLSTDEGPLAARAATAYGVGTPEQSMKWIMDDLDTFSKRLDKNPIVAPLNQLLLNISVTPPSQPGIYASLPDSMGGGRELDARQINLIVDGLEQQYKFSDQGALKNAATANSQLADWISKQIAVHNSRISAFRDIAKALEAVKGH